MLRMNMGTGFDLEKKLMGLRRDRSNLSEDE
jgi:hypothetical protein